MTDSKLGRPLQIGDWVVDPRVDTISRANETQKLEPRTMRLLMCLVEAAGEVVSIDRLLSEVWAGVVVGSASVYQSVSQLRRILGDTDPEPTYIATVPRKGYRLVAPVKVIEPVAPGPTSAPASISEQRNILKRVGITSVAIVVLMALTAIAWTPIKNYFRTAPEMSSIVVLPFIDLTEAKRDQTFCDGLTEELSNWLAQIPTLRVVARTSAFAFRGKGEDVRKIGRELGTTHVLEGSLRRSGDQVRVTVQLIDTRDGYHLWSADYDQANNNIIKIQEDISRAVAQNLEIRLTQTTGQRFAARGSSNAQAYQLYLLARSYYQQRTHEANERAKELYKQALAIDPKFTLAYVGLTYAVLNDGYFWGRPIGEVSAEVEPLLTAAMQLNPDMPDCYTARGALRAGQSRKEEALRDLGHALELNPNDSQAFAERGLVSLLNGEPREALLSYTHAADLDPLDPHLHMQRCLALQFLARFDEANEACERARALHPSGMLEMRMSSLLAWTRGRVDEALKWNALALTAASGEFADYQMRADLLLTLGLPTRAREILVQARTTTKDEQDIDSKLQEVVFEEAGAPGLRAYLAVTHLDESQHAEMLFSLAYSRLAIGDATVAKQVIERAFIAPDFDPHIMDDPWAAQQGNSYQLLVAATELKLGNQISAEQRLQVVTALLDRLQRAGVESWGAYQLRAAVQSLRGDTEGAMRALNRAVELGWRDAARTQHNPYFSALWQRNDFRALMKRVDQMNSETRATVSRLL